MFVAFDDDPEENILLVRTEEGKRAGANWLVDIRDPLIANAIARAKAAHRIAPVTGENSRTDVGASTAMIGDVTEKYASFIEKHRGRKLQTYVLNNSDCKNIAENNAPYVLNNSDCKNIAENNALIRRVWVGNDDYDGGLGANGSINGNGRARGVQKISTGNRGHLVSYTEIFVARRVDLITGPPATRTDDDVASVIAFFRPFEHSLNARARTIFYAGLGAAKEFIRTKEDLLALCVFLVTLATSAQRDCKDTTHLFDGLPLHRTIVRTIEDVRVVLLFYLRIVVRWPKQAATIHNDLKTLIDATLVTSTAQLIDVDGYLQEFQFLTPERYRQYLAIDPALRQAFLRNHRQKYLAIALGERLDITEADYDLIWYAVNSKNLTKEIIQNTLKRYGQEAAKLPKTSFAPFDIKDLAEIVGYKLKNPLRKELGTYLASIGKVLLETPYPYVDILRVLHQPGNDIPNDILALLRQPNSPIDNDALLHKAYASAYEDLKGKNYLHDIAWLLAVKYTVDQDLGEDQRRELEKTTTLPGLNYATPSKTEFETLLATYTRFNELYNDTIKHHFDDKNFLEKIHKPKSQILLIGKEIEKINPLRNNAKLHIRCIPSKSPLDLFYGYYGENCTSAYPQELFDEPFTPVRIIQMTDGEPTIEGCIHFYTTTHRGKKILAVLGIEPRGDFTNRSDPEKLFAAINDAIEEQAKTNKCDYVCYPENPTMHSNRGQISARIAEHIRNKDPLPIDITFPKDHPTYTTKKLYITWKR